MDMEQEERSIWSMLKQAFSNFFEDDALTLSGSLAFYAALALSPLLVLLLTATQFLGADTQQRMIAQMQTVIGPEAGQMVGTVISKAKQNPQAANLAGILGLITLAFSATGLFAQVQHSLNRIWDVQPKPSVGYVGWIRKRLVGLGLIVLIAVLLLASVVVTAALGFLLRESGWVWQVVNFAVGLGILTVLFAVTFKYLPDVRISWGNVWAGAFLTALLFTIGRHLIGLYLSHSSVGSSYGAAGSLVIMLLWVYYSAAIFFLGAELTQVYGLHSGRKIEPSRHAEWLPEARSKHRHAA